MKSATIVTALAGLIALARPAASQTPSLGITGPISTWKLEVEAGGKATAFPTPNGVVLLIDQTDGTDWHVQFERNNVDLLSGKRYTLTFRARASTRRILAVYGQYDKPDYHYIGIKQEMQLTPEWQTYSMTFKPVDTVRTESRVSFLLGQQAGRVDLTEIMLLPAVDAPQDEGSTAPSPSAPPPGTLRPVDQWDLDTAGAAQAVVTPSAGGAEVEIDKTDGAPGHVQLKQDGVALADGRSYTLQFKGKSTVARQIQVVAQSGAGAARSAGLDQRIRLTPSWQDYTLRFTATQPDAAGARIAFLLGSVASTVDLSDVELVTE